MKKATLYAGILSALFLLGITHISKGQILLNEDFDYPSGDLLTNHGWVSHSGSGTQPITVNNGGLSFNGYIGSGVGNSALSDNTGEDDNKSFTAQTSGVIYVGFMVKVVANAAGYFFHIGPNPISTTFRAKVFTDASNHFGVSVGSNTGTFSSSAFTVGSTYLLVAKYEIVSGATNDKVSLFVFDASLPTTEPIAATVGPLTDGTVSDISPASVAIRQFSTSQNFLLDGIRVTNSWSDLVGIPVTAPTIQAFDLTFSNVTESNITTSWSNGNGEKRVVIMSPDASITAPSDGTDPAANTVYQGSGDQVLFNGIGNSVTVSALQSNSPYWFQVFEYNGAGAGTKYCQASGNNNPGSQATLFVPTSPILSVPSASSITTTSALLDCTITDNGGSPITERGTVWSISTPVIISDNKLAEGGISTGSFSQLRTSLPPGTEIFYAAYAINGIGTSLSPQSSFFTLAEEPSNQATNLSMPFPLHSCITVTWSNNDGTQPATGFLILGNTSGTFTLPLDGVPQANDTVLVDGTGRVNVDHTTQSYTWKGLNPSTTYYFAIFPYTNSGSIINYKTTGTYPVTSATTTAIPVNTYAWHGADNETWTLASNWTPPRNTPAETDILIFNEGTTRVITAVPTQTIGKIVLQNNTKITLQNSASSILTIAGSAGVDLDVPAGCELNLAGLNAITVSLSAAATGSVYGSMTFSNSAHRLLSGTASGITFQAASVFRAATGFSGSPFGAATPYNAVIFASGSTYICQAGSNPFGAAAPNSTVVFAEGSLFKLITSITPSFSGRTYGNFQVDAIGANITASGSSAVVMQDLTITNGTLNFNVTGSVGHLIKGNILVESGASLNFSPTSAGTVGIAGTNAQTISGEGTITAGSLSTISLSNSAGITLDASLSTTGNVQLSSCLFKLNNGNLTLGSTSNLTGVFGITNMVIADGAGLLKKEFPPAGGSFTFPVGDYTGSADYSPVTITFSSGTFASGNYVGVNLQNAAYPLSPAPASYLNRYWNLATNGITGYSCDATFTYSSPSDIIGAEGDMTCARVAPLPVIAYSPANMSLHQLNATGMITLGTFTGTQVEKNLNLKVFLEGLYLANGLMSKAQNGSGGQFPGSTADQVIVELHDAAPGNFENMVYSSGPVNLSTSGDISIPVPLVNSGSYYIVIKHRNSILTVSSVPVSFSGTTIAYDFSIAASKAFGDNLRSSNDGVFMVYGGDVNQDGIVDSGDMIPLDNEGSLFSTGYLVSDVNGDGLVDSSDMMIVDNNGSLFIGVITP